MPSALWKEPRAAHLILGHGHAGCELGSEPQPNGGALDPWPNCTRSLCKRSRRNMDAGSLEPFAYLDSQIGVFKSSQPSTDPSEKSNPISVPTNSSKEKRKPWSLVSLVCDNRNATPVCAFFWTSCAKRRPGKRMTGKRMTGRFCRTPLPVARKVEK